MEQNKTWLAKAFKTGKVQCNIYAKYINSKWIIINYSILNNEQG